MAKKDNNLKHLIAEIKRFMKRAGASESVLFGSRANGTNLENSDVDLILISDRFGGVDFVRRLYPLHKLWTLPYYLEVLPYTPEELQKLKNRSVIADALENGIRIKA